ncbi:hypothetical protein D3C76_970230 [compost metagenome]
MLTLRRTAVGRGGVASLDQADIAQAGEQYLGQALRIIVQGVEVAPQHAPAFGQATFAVLLQQRGLAVAGASTDQDKPQTIPGLQLVKQGRTFQLTRQVGRREEFTRANGRRCSLCWFVGTTFKTFHASYLWLSSRRCGPF